MTPQNESTRNTSAVRCTNCGVYNAPNRITCENCGQPLASGNRAAIGDATTTTPVLPARRLWATRPIGASADAAVPPPSGHAAQPTHDTPPEETATDGEIRLEIVGAASTVNVAPHGESIVGRRDPISNSAPEVDLTSFAAYRMGISRRHAALRVSNGVVELLDLGSSNGTFVNGRRLVPNEPYALRSGDEIGLGRMLLRIRFLTA